MKTMKRFAGLLLALVMILTMTVTATADETTGSITIENPPAGNTYKAYKIFDVSYNGDKYAYTISSDSKWYSVVNAYIGSGDKGITLTQVGDTSKYNITYNSGKYSASDFVKYLRDNIPTPEPVGTEFTASGNNQVADGLGLGYYFIDTTGDTGGLCALTTTNPNAKVMPKNDVTFTKTDNGKTSVEIGEKVNYEINTTWPDSSQFTKYDFILSDEMSNGLTYNNDVSITINGNKIEKEQWGEYFDYSLTEAADGRNSGFTMTFKIKANEAKKLEKQPIVLNYSATVNENAVAKIEKNLAQLTYSNNPKKVDEVKTLTDEETVYSAKILVTKHADSEDGPLLDGATFVLRKQDGDSNVFYYQYNSTEKTVGWTKNIDEATKLTTDKDGIVEFKGLKNGSYRLQEVEAPAGYNLANEMVSFDIDGTDALKDNNAAALVYNAAVVNNHGTVLPGTGGMGTTLFYILGAILVIGAGVLLINRRRMNAGK